MVWLVAGGPKGSVSSKYCVEELGLAQAFGKPIFPVLCVPTELSGTAAEPYLSSTMCEGSMDFTAVTMDGEELEQDDAYEGCLAQLSSAIRYRLNHPKVLPPPLS